MDWLVANSSPRDGVLLVHDLGFLQQELARLPARPAVVWGDEAESEISARRPRYAVVGVLEREAGPALDVAALPALRDAYAVRFRKGSKPTPGVRSWWRGNDEIVTVLERVGP